MIRTVPRVLIVEDDRISADTLRTFVAAHGFDVSVAFDGEDALVRACAERPDVVLLDVMLPGLDGFEVCARMRTFSDAAIVMLTARTYEGDRLRGLDGGADDYVQKPYSLSEVVARIRAILRRTKPTVTAVEGTIRVGRAELDLRARSVRAGEHVVALTPTHFRLLLALAQSAGTPLSRNELIERVLGWDYDGLDRTIDVHVAALRKKLATLPHAGLTIATAFGVGYALEATR